MKRSFSALFVLLTALSGPLVFTPPAISRQSSSQDPTDKPAVTSLSRTEADQPDCLIPLDWGAAPEDLVVVPEDFDYEIYDEVNQCEIEQNAASGYVQNDTPALFHDVPTEADHLQSFELENLCLPFAEYESAVQPWEGPAIAGETLVEPVENFECERAAAEFAAEAEEREEMVRNQVLNWALNGYYEKSYAIESGIKILLENSSYSLLISAHWANNVAISQAERIVESVVELGRHAYGDIFIGVKSLSQTITASPLTEMSKSIPTPPFCECWARNSTEVEPVVDNNVEDRAPVDSTVETVSESVIEGIALMPISGDLEIGEFAENLGQNDVNEQQVEVANSAKNEPQSTDFSGLQNAAEVLWNAAKEQVETLERWSHEYEFEPNRTNELKFVSP